MPKPLARPSCPSWWTWRTPRRVAAPDAADHGTAYGLELSLQAPAREGAAATAGEAPPRRRAWVWHWRSR